MKKQLGIVGIGLILIFVTLMPSVISEQEINNDSTKLIALGFIRVNTNKYEINGFVLAGMNGNEVLAFQLVNIEYDGSPIQITHPVPFLWIINYNAV